MKPIKVLIADDHYVIRTGLTTILEIDPEIVLVGEAEDGADAVRKALQLRPDVVVMDLLMPVMDGIAAMQRLAEKLPSAKVLILTTSSVSEDIDAVLRAGARGVILKSSSDTDLAAVIKAVAAGERYIPSEVKKLIAEDPPVRPLTDRQSEILHYITRGLSNRDIANLLGIRFDSVKEHLNAIFTKLGATTRSEAVAIAMRKHLLKV